MQEDPGRPVFASTRSENKSAIKAIEKAGFTFFEKKEMPPLGKFTQPIDYVFFKFEIPGDGTET